jgi:anti-anti-sigma factor
MDYTYQGFAIETQRPAAKVVLLTLRGEVDVCTSFGLMEAIIAALAERPEVIAVDLSGLHYMDSAGLRVLLQSTRHLGDAGVHLAAILPPDHHLAQLPQLVGLHRMLSVHESMEDALGPWLDEAGELPTSV